MSIVLIQFPAALFLPLLYKTVVYSGVEIYRGLGFCVLSSSGSKLTSFFDPLQLLQQHSLVFLILCCVLGENGKHQRLCSVFIQDKQHSSSNNDQKQVCYVAQALRCEDHRRFLFYAPSDFMSSVAPFYSLTDCSAWTV